MEVRHDNFTVKNYTYECTFTGVIHTQLRYHVPSDTRQTYLLKPGILKNQRA